MSRACCIKRTTTRRENALFGVLIRRAGPAVAALLPLEDPERARPFYSLRSLRIYDESKEDFPGKRFLSAAKRW